MRNIDRRQFIDTSAAVAFGLLLPRRALAEQVALRPHPRGAFSRIARQNEIGTPLEISGRVFDQNQMHLAPGVDIYAYHTDASGLYRSDHYIPDWPERPPRLCGAVRTNESGRFTFATIRPAPYPSGTNPAHVHFTLWWPDGHRQSDTLWFDGDPLISDELRRAQDKRGIFSQIRPVAVTRDRRQLTEISFYGHDQEAE